MTPGAAASWLYASAIRHPGRVTVAVIGVLAILVIGVFDYLSGTAYRVFTLYFLPISYVGWHLSRRYAIAAASLCTVAWLYSNYAAFARFPPSVLAVNTTMQAIAFVTVALLLSGLRRSLTHERVLGRTDSLTELFNSRAFYEEAEAMLAVARRYDRPVSLGYLDLDGFKEINDTIGHARGDDVLQRVATIIRTSVRESDVVARLGGDEFVVLMPETGADGARSLMDRVRARIHETFSAETRPTASIGAVAYQRAPESLEEMVHAADIAMFEAKTSGGNRVNVTSAAPAAALEPGVYRRNQSLRRT